MKELAEVARLGRQVLDRVVERVCGACERNCCHQGTMMGSQDLRRLLRGLELDPELGVRLRQGLMERSAEVSADVEAARQVLDLVRASGLGEEHDLSQAERRIGELEDFAELLASDFPFDYEHLHRLTLHTALRYNVIKALRIFPGAEGALARFAGELSSFKLRRRRLAPPRCLFHSLSLGCLAGSWKPAKCANFVCNADPSLLDALRECMDFDDFVLAAFEPVSLARLEATLAVQVRLGQEYHEPLIVLGLTEAQLPALADFLREAGIPTELVPWALPALTADAIERFGRRVPPGEARLLPLPSLRATDVYELAIGLERLRRDDEQRLLVLAAAEYVTPSRPAHPLWTEHTISQPVGYLEGYILVDEEAAAPADSQSAGPQGNTRDAFLPPEQNPTHTSGDCWPPRIAGLNCSWLTSG